MFADKSVLDEHHPRHLEMYDGRLANEDVRAFVESCDHGGGVYIEVVTDRYTAAPLAQRLHDNIDALYGA